jgi:hypothetical protein
MRGSLPPKANSLRDESNVIPRRRRCLARAVGGRRGSRRRASVSKPHRPRLARDENHPRDQAPPVPASAQAERWHAEKPRPVPSHSLRLRDRLESALLPVPRSSTASALLLVGRKSVTARHRPLNRPGNDALEWSGVGGPRDHLDGHAESAYAPRQVAPQPLRPALGQRRDQHVVVVARLEQRRSSLAGYARSHTHKRVNFRPAQKGQLSTGLDK